jgi:hypothetical protein
VLKDNLAEAARVTSSSLGDVVALTTRNGSMLSEAIAGWVQSSSFRIFEMRTADDSLQSLFNSLMKIHRGEL